MRQRTAAWRRGARVIAAALCVAAAGSAHALPTFAEVRAAHHPSDVVLTDRHGVPIQTMRVDKQVRRLAWVPIASMSPALLQAIVLSEDKRFYDHSGVDWSAVATSAWGNVWNSRTRGASTLTMQLAGLIDDGLARPSGGRSVIQKLGQAVTAARLEATWKKSEILEAYLNSVGFRGEIVGIDALSATLFGKHASGLDAQEAAIAAALLRGPNSSAAVVADRACGVLKLQQLDCLGVIATTASALVRQGGMPLAEQIAPHLARQVVRADGPTLQRSTLDAGVQRIAVSALRRQLGELVDRNVEDGAVVVLDNASGEVLAWVGSSGSLSSAAQVDGVLARRQPGSALKPFVYELAFEKKLITPASLIDDAPAQFATGSGLYLPQNYEHDFKGWVSARTALGASLNVPAVRVGALLGPDALVARLNALGLALAQPGGFYGNGLALGAPEVSLIALTNAYRALANGGVVSSVRFTGSAMDEAKPAVKASTPSKTSATSVTSATPVRVAAAAAVFLVTDILADNSARVRTFGFDSALATRGFAAVKTGTSKDMRDNWCIGFTDRFTVGVWVGNASGEPMHGVSGISGAAPVWQALVQALHQGTPSRRPERPDGIVDRPVRLDAGREPVRDELFLTGTEPSAQTPPRHTANERRLVASVNGRHAARLQRDAGIASSFGIASPRDGSIFAIDPDIPPAAQRITFEGEAGVWVLDGKRLGDAATIAWSPWPGPHVLTLQARSGEPLQTVRFEVRGAGVKSAAAAGAKAR